MVSSVIVKDRYRIHYQFENTECEARGKLSNLPECIPVGCVPSAAVAVSVFLQGVCPGSVCLVGVSSQQGVYLGGMSAWGVSAWEGGVCLLGVSAWERGVCPVGCLPTGHCLSGVVCPGRGLPDFPPWTEWQTGVNTILYHNYNVDSNNTWYRGLTILETFKASHLLIREAHYQKESIILMNRGLP